MTVKSKLVIGLMSLSGLIGARANASETTLACPASTLHSAFEVKLDTEPYEPENGYGWISDADQCQKEDACRFYLSSGTAVRGPSGTTTYEIPAWGEIDTNTHDYIALPNLDKAKAGGHVEIQLIENGDRQSRTGNPLGINRANLHCRVTKIE